MQQVDAEVEAGEVLAQRGGVHREHALGQQEQVVYTFLRAGGASCRQHLGLSVSG